MPTSVQAGRYGKTYQLSGAMRNAIAAEHRVVGAKGPHEEELGKDNADQATLIHRNKATLAALPARFRDGGPREAMRRTRASWARGGAAPDELRHSGALNWRRINSRGPCGPSSAWTCSIAWFWSIASRRERLDRSRRSKVCDRNGNLESLRHGGLARPHRFPATFGVRDDPLGLPKSRLPKRRLPMPKTGRTRQCRLQGPIGWPARGGVAVCLKAHHKRLCSAERRYLRVHTDVAKRLQYAKTNVFEGVFAELLSEVPVDMAGPACTTDCGKVLAERSMRPACLR